MKSWIKYLVIGLIILAVLGIYDACRDHSWDEYDNIMGSTVWGPDHYYDSTSHEVKEKPW